MRLCFPEIEKKVIVAICDIQVQSKDTKAMNERRFLSSGE